MLVNFLILHSVGWCINVPCVIRTVAIWQLVSQKMVVAYDRCLTSKKMTSSFVAYVLIFKEKIKKFTSLFSINKLETLKQHILLLIFSLKTCLAIVPHRPN